MKMKFLCVAATLLLSVCNAAVLTVEPGQSIQDALDLAQPGDTVELKDGEYREDLVTVRDGEPDKRIVISGSRNAVLKGTGKESRLFQCFHSYITIDGFTIDGQFGKGDKAEHYTDKLLYIMGGETRVIKQYGTEFRSGIDGVIVSNMRIVNAQGECLRARYFVTNLEVVGCHIENCGVEDFVFGDMKAKNGEVIYLGTSSNQISDGKNPTNEIDQTRYVWIHDCVFKSEGNEVSWGDVDAKEGSEYILIEHNSCSTQKDPDSACLDTRSDHVVFRYNTLFDNDGAGVRIGGHTVDGKVWGLNNEVYGNTFHNNAAGALKIQTGSKEHPHLCQNECKGGCKVGGSASEGNEDIEKKCGDGVMDIFWVDENKAVAVAQSVRSTNTAVDGGEPEEFLKKPEPEFEATVTKSSKKSTESDKCYPVPIKDVSASSEQGKHTVHAAIDRKSLTRWSSEGKGEWLKIELDGTTTVDSVEISFFKGDERTQAFELAADGNTILKKQQSSGKTLAMQRFPFPQEVRASTVMITGGGNTENDWNSLTEVIVCGVDEPKARDPKNTEEVCDKVEKLKIDMVSASADDGDQFKAANLIDGDLNTRWSAEGLGEEEIKITLGKPSTVSEIGLAVYNGDKVKAFFDLMVETEAHGWEEVVRDGESVKGKGIVSYDLGMEGVKQVKVVGYAAEDLESGEQVGLNSFAEIELYGC